MGIAIGKRRFLFEAEDDNTTPDEGFSSGGTTKEDSTDNKEDNENADQNKDNQNNDNTDENQEEDQNTDEDNTDDEISDDDFSIDSTMDDTEDDNTDAENNDSGEKEEDAPPSTSKVKETEKEIFDSLSPEEKKNKTKELKNLFMDLYSNCNNIIDRLNQIAVEIDEVHPQVRRTINVLFETKKMISDYLLNIFDSKSYIENDIMFNTYLSVFNSVKNITNEIKNIYKDDNESK